MLSIKKVLPEAKAQQPSRGDYTDGTFETVIS